MGGQEGAVRGAQPHGAGLLVALVVRPAGAAHVARVRGVQGHQVELEVEGSDVKGHAVPSYATPLHKPRKLFIGLHKMRSNRLSGVKTVTTLTVIGCLSCYKTALIVSVIL